MAFLLARRSRTLLRSGQGKCCMIPTRGLASDELVSDAEDSASNGDRQVRIPAFQGVYKAVILGEVTQPPVEVARRNGRSLINLMVATGGMRVQRKMNEDTRNVKQIHKVVVYQDRIKELVTARIKKGNQVYLEGNMESRVFNDAVTGAVKLTREIAIRQNGRLFLVADLELKGVNNKTPAANTKEKEATQNDG